MIKNYIYIENKKQGFPSPPPLNTRKSKAPENCFRSYIDQIADGFYSSSKLVRNSPRNNRDIYFILRTIITSVRSYSRNYSHKSVALYRTKKEGSTRKNIEYMTGSFLELDGSTDGTIKTRGDIFTLVREKNLPKPSYAIETSQGHFHVIWNYNNPLPWTNKGESYWVSQQKRLIELFKRAGFLVDEGASLNPTQNLRNPSQLNPYNFKRRCEVFIHKSYQKTSLRAICRALNGTNIPNPRIKASTKLRRFLRANKTFTLTYQELADALGVSLRTVKREVEKAISNGDMFSAGRVGNNKGIKRATRYESGLYIEPQFSGVPHSISKTILSGNQAILVRFQTVGAIRGQRHRTIFALGLYLKFRSRGAVTLEELVDALAGGSRRSGISDREFIRALKNVLKSNYTNPLSMSKLREWGLLQETMCNSKYHDIPLH